MKKITLPNGRITTQLGFGCGALHGGLEAQRSARIIDVAYEAGFRHFDVAPSYGLGLAETVLGRALQPRRAEVSVATKAGIGRPARPLLMSVTRSVVKPVMARLPGWRSAAQKARSMTSPSGIFDLASVRASLEQSLAQLRTSHIDIFLMHEMRIADVTPALIALLVESKAAGIVGALGTGTLRSDAIAIAAAAPELAEVQQYRWNVEEPRLNPSADAITITHGGIMPTLLHISSLLRANPTLRDRWSSALDLDLADRAALGDLLLGAALAENPHGIVLVHSQQPHRIRRFVAVASNELWHRRGAILSDLVAQHRSEATKHGSV